MSEDYYSLLKVTRDAPEEVIRASYNSLIRKVHPDVGGGDAELAGRLNAARATLLDPVKRAEHDRELAREETPDPVAEPEPEQQPEWGSEQGWDDPEPVPTPAPPPYQPPTPTPPPPYSPPGDQQTGFDPTWQTPPPYDPTRFRGRLGVIPSAGDRLSLSARDLWRGTTTGDRVTIWLWLALTLVGPVGVTIAALNGVTTNIVENLVIYAVLTLASLHVARERILRQKLPKRYLIWVIGAALFTYALGRESVWGGLYAGCWLVLFLLGTELRRRHLWARN